MSESNVKIEFKVSPEVAQYLMAFYVVYERDIGADLGWYLILDKLPAALSVLIDALGDGDHNFDNLDWDDSERLFMKKVFGID